MTRYMRWLESERGLELRRLRGAVGVVDARTSRRSGARSGSSSTSRRTTTRCSPTPRCRAPSGSRAPRSPTRSTSSATGPATAWRSATPPSCATSGSGRGTSCASRPPASPPACKAMGDRARRPRRRLHAEHPRDDRRLPRHREPRRGLVELLAGLRGAQRRRPLRPDRAEGAADRRRLPLRRQGPRPQRADRARAGRDALARAHGDARLPRRRRGRLGRGVPAHRRGAHVRARALRPPDVGPLLLGHDRPAEGDRALAGRDPASSTSRSTTCTSTRRRATASSGSPPRAG